MSHRIMKIMISNLIDLNSILECNSFRNSINSCLNKSHPLFITNSLLSVSNTYLIKLANIVKIIQIYIINIKMIIKI